MRLGSHGVSIFAATAAMFLTITLSGCSRDSQASWQDSTNVVRAADSYVNARVAAGAPRPSSVKINELVEAGLITQKLAKQFEGAAIDVLPEYATASNEIEDSNQDILVRLRSRDGQMLGLFSDGRIELLVP